MGGFNNSNYIQGFKIKVVFDVMKLKPCNIITYCQSATTTQQIILTATLSATQLQIVRRYCSTPTNQPNTLQSCFHLAAIGTALITLYCMHFNTLLQHICAVASSLYYCITMAAYINSSRLQNSLL